MENKMWEFIPANNFCVKVTDGTHDSPKKTKNGRFLVTSKNFVDYKIDYHNAYKISEEDYKKIIKRSKVEQWDILISMIGTVGLLYIEKNKEIPYACKNVGIFKVGGNEIKSKWIYYFLKSPYAKEYIHSNLRGTTQMYIPLESLRKMPILNPPFEIQRKIVSILSAIDEKIELNNRIFENLEKINSTLFHNIFNDKFVCSSSEILSSPTNTKWVTIGSVIKKRKEKFKQQNEWLSSPIIDLSIMPQFSTNISYFNDGRNFTTNINKLYEYDLIFGSIRCYFGKAGFSPIDGGVAGTVFSFVPIDNLYYPFLLQLITSREFIDLADKLSTGTKMPIINWKTFCGIKIAVPISNQTFESFNKLSLPNITMRKKIMLENLKLAKIRDTLLPKLMSGGIDVSKMEIN